MILVRPAKSPSAVWNVVQYDDLEGIQGEGHFIALGGGNVDEIVVFLKSVRPRRILVHLEDDSLFNSLSSAFTPDKVMRAKPNI